MNYKNAQCKEHLTKIYLNFLCFFVFNSTLLSIFFLHTYGDMLIFSLECKQVLPNLRWQFEQFSEEKAKRATCSDGFLEHCW